ncbi:hypothetical protein [Natrinema sp. H-ect4]|uniref:hypothetical protein n=1 Tax=Natrinema sp. H-ect4 TaxID=3242699 RepID=UPI0035A8F675
MDGTVEHIVVDAALHVDSSGGRPDGVDAPEAAGFESGTYLIYNWRLSFASYQDRWRVELEEE